MNTELFSKKPFVIGMVHFGSLFDATTAAGRQRILAYAQQDLDALIQGGVDGVMFENMYDQPHAERLDPGRRELFHDLVRELVQRISVPFGLSVLWNDYDTAFEVASKTGASWIRVPVFVDSVETVYGVFRADPSHVLRSRKEQHAESIRILADIQVKHAKMLQPRSIAESAKDAEAQGADGIIITGTWTGEPARLEDVKEAGDATSLPVFIGSGITEENISSYASMITGVIVGTALKKSGSRPVEEERLRTPESARIDPERVRSLVRAARIPEHR